MEEPTPASLDQFIEVVLDDLLRVVNLRFGIEFSPLRKVMVKEALEEKFRAIPYTSITPSLIQGVIQKMTAEAICECFPDGLEDHKAELEAFFRDNK